jgi:hypothetical protein
MPRTHTRPKPVARMADPLPAARTPLAAADLARLDIGDHIPEQVPVARPSKARLTREARGDGKDRLSRRLAEDGVHVDPAVHDHAPGRPEGGRLLLASQLRQPRRSRRSAEPDGARGDEGRQPQRHPQGTHPRADRQARAEGGRRDAVRRLRQRAGRLRALRLPHHGPVEREHVLALPRYRQGPHSDGFPSTPSNSSSTSGATTSTIPPCSSSASRRRISGRTSRPSWSVGWRRRGRSSISGR